VAYLLEVLAKSEGRDEPQVYRDLVCADRDVVRVRTTEADDDGSVKIDAGVDIFLQARELLLSAACAAKDPRPSYRAGKIKEATSYMDRVRLGQTEHGSFVATLLAPVPPSLATMSDQKELWPAVSEEPYERLVTRSLATGLDAAKAAAEQSVRGGGLSPFQKAVSRGVSANLCEALANLIDQGDGVDISVTWARTRPTPSFRHRTVFERDEGGVLREAARLFRSQEPRPDERMEAFVVGLGRTQEAEIGTITLKTFLDGKPASVKVVLPSNLYSVAVQAHEERKSVSIVGDLKRQGQRWWLDAPREFTIVLDETDEGVLLD
jgi:hypothetical protein